MRQFILILFLFGLILNSNSQELTIKEFLCTDMLEFKSEKQADQIAENLWQVGVEVEIQEGYLEKEKRYYIEIQDLSILDIEIQENGKWIRIFPESVKKKLIKVKFEEE